jgi:IrrE N-terminal-like domain
VRVAVWAYHLAHEFWNTLGVEEGFPREFEHASAYPLTVKRLPGLTFGAIGAWLKRVEIVVNANPDRPLCGCLVATRGQAFLFVDAGDSADEQRFSLAHELAHFLRDVWRPRERVVRVLGAAAAEVCDDRRGATREERVSAALEGVDLGIQVHLLPRDADGRPATDAIADAEDCADLLAFELLAPAAHLAQSGADALPAGELITRLATEYGLPRREAARYVAWLRPPAPQPDRWLRALRAPV